MADWIQDKNGPWTPLEIGKGKTPHMPTKPDLSTKPVEIMPKIESRQPSSSSSGVNGDMILQPSIQSLCGLPLHSFHSEKGYFEHEVSQCEIKADLVTKLLGETNAISLSPVGETLSISASDTGREDELLSSSSTSFSEDMMSDDGDCYSGAASYAMARDWTPFDFFLLPLQDKVLAYLLAQASHHGLTTHTPDTQSTHATQKNTCDSSPSQQIATNFQGSNNGLKRSTNCGSGNNKDENDEGNDEDQQRRDVGGQSEENASPYFACHFAKYNPLRYSKCARLRFENVSRIKTHLRLRHMCPVHCAICNKVFTGDQAEKEFAAHQRARSCTKRLRCLIDGITKAQQKELIRRMGQRRGRTETEKWYAIWDVIFCSEPPPDSPHNDELVESAVLDFQCFSERMVHTVMEEFSSTLPRDSQGPSIDQLMSFFIWLYPRFQRRVHERWVSSTRGSSPTRYTSSSLSGSPDGASLVAPAATPASSGRESSGSVANIDVISPDADEPPRNYVDAYEQRQPLHRPQYAAPPTQTTQETPAYGYQAMQTFLHGQELPIPLESAGTTFSQSLLHPLGSQVPQQWRLSRIEFIEMLRNATDEEFFRLHPGDMSRLQMIEHLCQIDEAEYARTYPEHSGSL